MKTVQNVKKHQTETITCGEIPLVGIAMFHEECTTLLEA